MALRVGYLLRSLMPVIGLLYAASANAAPMKLWFSLSDQHPFQAAAGQPTATQPVAPTLSLKPGAVIDVYLWGQPQTMALNPPYNTSTNAFKQLVALSLDLTATGPSAAVTAAVFDNPAGQRFQKVLDSAPGNQSTHIGSGGTPEVWPLFNSSGIQGLQAVTYTAFEAPQPTDGVGPTCGAGVCVTTASGPAWRLGFVTLNATTLGTTSFRM